MPGEWESLRDRLAGELASLADGEFLVLGEPAGDPGPPRGLLRRRAAPPPTRFVQFRGDGEHLYGECVGATLFGGDWELTSAQHERLRGLGWLAPGDEDPAGVQPPVPHYWVLLPGDEVDAMARLGAGALELLDVDPASLEWRRDR